MQQSKSRSPQDALEPSAAHLAKLAQHAQQLGFVQHPAVGALALEGDGVRRGGAGGGEGEAVLCIGQPGEGGVAGGEGQKVRAAPSSSSTLLHVTEEWCPQLP